MESKKIDEMGNALFCAMTNRIMLEPLSHFCPNITEEDGYSIQQAVAKQYAEHGYHSCGWKIGGIDISGKPRAKNAFGPHYGRIFKELIYKSSEVIPYSKFIQPGIEAEIAFVLREDFYGGNSTGEQVMEVTDYLLPAWEIVDSRQVKKQRILPDSIADNASFGGCVLGGRKIVPVEIYRETIGLSVKKGSTSFDVQCNETTIGNAAAAVAWLANRLSEKGGMLKKGEIIISGALTSPLIPVKPEESFCASFDLLGDVIAAFF